MEPCNRDLKRDEAELCNGGVESDPTMPGVDDEDYGSVKRPLLVSRGS
jgi:hypothetical protein